MTVETFTEDHMSTNALLFMDEDHPGRLNLEQLVHEFKREEGAWNGYIEWEKCPEKAAKAEAHMRTIRFPDPPEFQLQPLPKTNPVIEGVRWKLWHEALGPHVAGIPSESWAVVKKEKAADMIHLLDFPYNGETPRDKLLANYVTPNEYHFVRNHGGIPTMADESLYELEIGGLVARPGKLSLAQLKDEALFPQSEVLCTIQCSGTRRIEQIALYAGEGDEMINAPWGEGAIGTARYKGVMLKKIIKYFGGALPEGKHIESIGADTYFKKNKLFNYATSVPWRKVQSKEVMVCWEMNGKPLPKIHGAPLRLLVFGYIGARSTKWLTRINVLPEPSMGPVQRQEYLYFNSQIGKHNMLFSQGFSIQDMPVSSALLKPTDMQVCVHDGAIHVEGWAYSGGGRWVVRVEVSPDGGFTWFEVPGENLSPMHYHALRLWQMELPIHAEGWLELVVRCWDNAINTQPTYVRSAWNWDLHVTSSAHRVKVYSVNKSRPATAARLKAMEQHGVGLNPITLPIEFSIEPEEEYLANMKKKGSREPEV